MTSARKAKRRVMSMMAASVVIPIRWDVQDPDTRRRIRWLQVHTGSLAHLMRKEFKGARVFKAVKETGR